MGDGKVLEKMGERRKYVRRDATVGRLSAIFLEDMVGSVKPSTLACYRRNIQCHILPALGECVAAELTAAEINDYIRQLQEDYSPKLVREVGGLLLRIVGMAGVGYGEDVTLPKVRQKAVEVFTEPELKQMGQVILRRPDRTGLGVLLTAYTGLRLGELCGLQWQDVDVGAGLLHIQRTVERIAQIGGGTCLTVQPPKTENSERWIPIPKEMLRMLKPETKQPDSYLLTGGEIVPDPRAMQYRYKALLERCGIDFDAEEPRMRKGDLSALQNCPFVMGRADDINGRMGRALLSKGGVKPIVKAMSGNIETLLALCEEGVGACFSPENLVHTALGREQASRLHLLRFEQGGVYPIRFGYLKRSYQWSIVEAFIRMARESLQE